MLRGVLHFIQTNNLKKHKSVVLYSMKMVDVRIHTGERHLKCEMCNAAFSQNGSLKQHVWIHAGERPFKCEECSAVFSQSDT